LQRASVVGRVFWTAAVGSLTGRTDVAELLEALADRDMVVTHETSAFADTTEYAFRHTVLRDVAYESVLIEERSRLHGLAADWLLAHTHPQSVEMIGMIATHLEKAGRDVEALDYLTRAGEAARAGYAVAAAADYFDRALALVPPGDLAHRYDLLLGRQEISGLQGDREHQEQVLDELDAVAEQLGEPGKRAVAAIERTWLHFFRGEFPTMLAAADGAADLASAGGDRLLESRARSVRAWAYLSLEHLDRAEEDARAALSLAEQAGSRRYEAAALNTLGMISLVRGDPSRASVHLIGALALARDRGDRGGESIYLNNLAVARMMLGDFESARGHFGRMFELAEAAGDETLVASAYANLAWVASSLTEWETAHEMAERGRSMMRHQGHREGEAETLLWLGHALTGLGRTDEALEAYGRSLVIREDLGQTALAVGVLAGIARAHLASGHLDRALGYAERIVEYLDAGGSLDGTWEPLRIHLTCVEVFEAVGDDRRDRVLARARAALNERAAKIADAADRRMLIEAIPWHRVIRERAAANDASGNAPDGG
jgi:tetratricopeptide (TPR) repeat protein